MQYLKDAEKKASGIVADARKARVDRMKEAKSEAEKIISTYKAEKESSYQAALGKQAVGSGSSSSVIEAETNNAIDKLSRDFNKKKDSVETLLLDIVTKVEIKAPVARA